MKISTLLGVLLVLALTGMTGAAQAQGSNPCLTHLMGGTVNWGGGTVWEPDNAQRLCAGAKDLSPVKCFEARIAKKTPWPEAISACQVGAKPAVASAPPASVAAGSKPEVAPPAKVAAAPKPEPTPPAKVAAAPPSEPPLNACMKQLAAGIVDWGGVQVPPQIHRGCAPPQGLSPTIVLGAHRPGWMSEAFTSAALVTALLQQASSSL